MPRVNRRSRVTWSSPGIPCSMCLALASIRTVPPESGVQLSSTNPELAPLSTCQHVLNRCTLNQVVHSCAHCGLLPERRIAKRRGWKGCPQRKNRQLRRRLTNQHQRKSSIRSKMGACAFFRFAPVFHHTSLVDVQKPPRVQGAISHNESPRSVFFTACRTESRSCRTHRRSQAR